MTGLIRQVLKPVTADAYLPGHGDSSFDVRPQGPQPQTEHDGAGCGASEPRSCDDLHERVGKLVAPHEGAPQRVVRHP